MDPAAPVIPVNGVAVVDASVLAALAFLEPNAAVARDRLADRQLVAPRLLAYELMSAASKKLRKHPDQAALIRGGLSKALGDDFAIFWSDVEPDEVIDLAVEARLTTYDASYLWLARHLGAELVTFDGALEAAAQRYLSP
jgi:predicted nucleic acid-binding protein